MTTKPEGTDDIKTVDDLKTDDGKQDEPLEKKDVTGFTPEQTAAHLKDLRTEAGARRIATKEAKAEVERLNKERETTNTTLSELQAKVDTFEKDKKDADLADASELVKLTSELEDSRKSLKELEKAKKKADADLVKSNLKVNDKDRESQIDRLVVATGKSFSSTYERDGFIRELLKRDDKGVFELDLEETVLHVDKFFKQKKIIPDETPGAGPNDRSTDTSLAGELKALMSKKDLSTEENLRLREISKLMVDAKKTGA